MDLTSPEDTDLLPVNALSDLAATLLAPMFLAAAGGDVSFARAAALSMVKSYGATTQADLLCVVQIIAFGLASLRTLMLSMNDDVPLPLLLRATISADRLSKAELRHRKIRETQQSTAAEAMAPEDAVPASDEPVPIQVAPSAPAMQPHVEATLRRVESEIAANDPHSQPRPRTQAEWRKVWGESAARVADEYLANLDGLSPEERETNLLRADALKRASRDLLSGASMPRFPDWSFLKPR